MGLDSGSRLGAYEIVGAIGAGGMGEVYRARDTQLGRDVAIKALPDDLLHDNERRARFVREAKLLAALNHSNIATLYGLEEAEARQFLVMELVEGETLAERISRGPIPWDEALSLFVQIAEGLEAAHTRGILHRDLKPANIKVTPEGKVKILDFGLAKLAESDDGLKPDGDSRSPTLTKGTALGAIMGTASYMSPEQAKGKHTDQRTDVWAFGCVLYEALTGQRAFAGDDVSEILASVLRDEPSWSAIPSSVPSSTVEVVRRCLRKDVRRRIQHVGDARVGLEDIDAESVPARAAPTRVPLWVVVALVLALGLAAWGWLRKLPEPPSAGVTRSEIVLEYPIRLDLGQRNLVISPDGARIAVVVDIDGTPQLYVRELSESSGRLLPGTEGAADLFFSRDGRSLGYVGEDNFLRTLSLDGGSPERRGLVSPVTRGGAWLADDVIVMNTSINAGLAAFTREGSRRLSTPDRDVAERSHRWPHSLPGRKNEVIFSVIVQGKDGRNGGGDFAVELMSLETGMTRSLLEGGADARVTASGHLLFGRDQELFATRVDPRSLQPVDTPVEVIRGVASQTTGAYLFDVSDSGLLVYVEGGRTTGQSTIGWVDRDGAFDTILEYELPIYDVSLSPDGRRLAMTRVELGNSDLWTYDLERDIATRLTFDPGEDFNPIWSPDGEWIAFASEMNGEPPRLHRTRADGAGEPQGLFREAARPALADVPTTWSPDQSTILQGGFGDVSLIKVDGSEETTELIATEYYEHGARFSPDGNWVVFHSDESGRPEVYVQPFPGPGAKHQVSNDGGTWPLWDASGRKIFYRIGDRMMEVAIQTEPALELSRPRLLFTARYSYGIGHSNYDVAKDGRFLMIRNEVPTSTNRIVLVTNWFEQLPKE